MWYDPLLERRLAPDLLIRREVRKRLRRLLADGKADDAERAQDGLRALLATMRESPVAGAGGGGAEPREEVPPAFFELALGARLKDSCALFGPGVASLGEAEEAMLALTCERAQLADGQNVLELGCGWGSLTLFMAERYPASRIVAVSTSKVQRDFLEARAKEQGIANVKVVTADMNVFDPATGPEFDQVVSVETLERMRNWPELLGRIATWMRADARLFVHVGAHRDASFLAEPRGEEDGSVRPLVPGGLTPSDALLLHCADHVVVEDHWRLSGVHYRRTAEAWVANLDRNRRKLLALFRGVHGREGARRRLLAWRVAFLARAELWGFRGGNEWIVSHYRLRRRR